jgi:hypothetical protein
MVVTKIGEEYPLHIPDQYHELIRIGQDVSVSADQQGRLVTAPVDEIQTALEATFGMWADRPEAQTDSVDIVNDIRRDQRVDQLMPNQ